MIDVDFVVATGRLDGRRRPVIGVDGPVQGADLCFDHHATGEPVNLLTIPDVPPFPGTLATTMLDSDAVISAAVVILRARGEGAAVAAQWEALYEAAHFCDHLVPSGAHPAAEQAGLGLHCWLKERGLLLSEALAWSRGELRGDGHDGLRVAPSERTKSEVFGVLTAALVTGLTRQAVPRDLGYLERLGAMASEARRAVRTVDGRVTVVAPSGYVDPLALYRVVETDFVVIVGKVAGGGAAYSIGVNPRAYGRVDLRPVFAALNAREPGWGGRANAGGSPQGAGSALPLEDVVAFLNAAE